MACMARKRRTKAWWQRTVTRLRRTGKTADEFRHEVEVPGRYEGASRHFARRRGTVTGLLDYCIEQPSWVAQSVESRLLHSAAVPRQAMAVCTQVHPVVAVQVAWSISSAHGVTLESTSRFRY